MSDETTIQEIVAEAQSESVFSFAEVAQGRGYPKDEVELYLDEETAYELDKALRAGDEEKAKALREKLNQSRYVFKIQGIPSELRDDLVEKAREEIKPEYDQIKNFVTGQIDKREKPSNKRGKLIGTLLWAAHIQQIVAPDGKVDTAPGRAAAQQIWTLPASQISKFQDAIDKLSVASEAFEVASDDDFPESSSDLG